MFMKYYNNTLSLYKLTLTLSVPSFLKVSFKIDAISVDFPDPIDPTTATSFPGDMLKFMLQ